MKIILFLLGYYIFLYKVIRNCKKKNSIFRINKFSLGSGYKNNIILVIIKWERYIRI